MSERTIRVGVIGAGANTIRHHLPGLRAQEGVEIVAVANRSLASSRKVAEDFAIPRACAHWPEILEDRSIDALCIGTWPYMHAPLTIAALDAGKHVLCEARMAMNATEARAMLAASRRRPDLVAQIVPAPMTLAFDRTIIDMIGEGFIGDLILVDARISDGAFPLRDSPLHWRQDRDLSGNNVMSMGIWYEAVLRWLGPACSVQALGRNVVRHRRDAQGRRRAMSIPDHLDVICEMEQGGHLRLSVSTVIGLVPAVEIYVCGSEGTLRLSDTSGGLTLEAGRRGASALSPVAIPEHKRGGWRVEEEFVNAIRGLEPITHTDFGSALKYMEWTDAVNRAMRTGVRVPLPLAASAS